MQQLEGLIKEVIFLHDTNRSGKKPESAQSTTETEL